MPTKPTPKLDKLQMKSNQSMIMKQKPFESHLFLPNQLSSQSTQHLVVASRAQFASNNSSMIVINGNSRDNSTMKAKQSLSQMELLQRLNERKPTQKSSYLVTQRSMNRSVSREQRRKDGADRSIKKIYAGAK